MKQSISTTFVTDSAAGKHFDNLPANYVDPLRFRGSLEHVFRKQTAPDPQNFRLRRCFLLIMTPPELIIAPPDHPPVGPSQRHMSS